MTIWFGFIHSQHSRISWKDFLVISLAKWVPNMISAAPRISSQRGEIWGSIAEEVRLKEKSLRKAAVI